MSGERSFSGTIPLKLAQAFLALVALAPFIVVPFSPVSAEAAKSVLLVPLAALMSLIALYALMRGWVRPPETWVFAIGASLLIIAAVSVFFSGTIRVALAGTGFEFGTFVSIAVFVAAAFSSAVLVASARTAFGVLYALSLSAGVVLGWEALTLVFSIFGAEVSRTLLGSIHNLGLFAGVVAIVAAYVVDWLSPGGLSRVFFYYLLVVSLLFVYLSGVPAFVVPLAVFAVSSIVCALLQRGGASAIPVASSIALVALAVTLFSPSLFNSLVPAGRQGTEVRPSFATSVSVLRESAAEGSRRALLGVGPGTYSYVWERFKPESVNGTLFWDADVVVGHDVPATLAPTIGILGAAAFVALCAALIVEGARGALAPSHGGTARVTVPLLSIVTFGTTVSFLYVPSALFLFIIFVCGGSLVGLVSARAPSVSREMLGVPRIALISIAAVCAVLVVAFSVLRLASLDRYERGALALRGESGVGSAASLFSSAAALASIALYERSLSQAYQISLDELAGGGTSTVLDPKAEVQRLAREAIESGKRSVVFGPLDYRNHLALGGIYARLARFSVLGAFEKARASYERAIELSPRSPVPLFVFAQALVAVGDTDEAVSKLEEALNVKPDYAPARTLLESLR